MDVEKPDFDASTFSKNRSRLMEHAMAPKFFAEVVALARAAWLLDNEHFTVDGTLIEACTSAKSFRPKTDQGQPSKDNFHGQKRRHDTHPSTTDGDARLMRKGTGKEARLSFGAHCANGWPPRVLRRFECDPRHRERTAGRYQRTRHTKAYRRSVKRIFVWGKGVGDLPKTRYRGLPHVTLHTQLLATTYNLLRIANLMPVPA